MSIDERRTILIVDDIPSNRDLLEQTLETQGYEIFAAASGEQGLHLAQEARPDLILLDIVMPAGINGFETCRRIKANPATRDIPVIFITAKEDEDSIEEGFEAGAVDYITKPFREREVVLRVATHLKISYLTQSLQQQNRELSEEITRRKHAEDERNAAIDARQRSDGQLHHLSHREAERWGIAGFVGQSPTIGRILDHVRRLQDVGTTSVLIMGESGTGKELIARAIHVGGPREQGAFIPVNCSAIPAELAESTFFGHVRGAFTGANSNRQGCFELADGGTLFLDEIGDMSLELQAKLLRVLEDGCITPIGGQQERYIDVRVLAATNADLETKIEAGHFRRDLYFRLARFTVDVPPLRERSEDIPLLVQHFLETFGHDMGRPHMHLSQAAIDRLQCYEFPGNVRELRNIIERAMIENESDVIRPEHLHLIKRPSAVSPSPAQAGYSDSGLEIPQRQPGETELILAYVQQNGSISNAECRSFLGIDRHRAFYLLEKLQQEQRLMSQGASRSTRYYPFAHNSA